MRTDIIAIGIIALIIGVAVGYFAAPPKVGIVTTTIPGTTVTSVITSTYTTTVEKPIPPLTGEIPIGVLTQLSGELGAWGDNYRVALELAASEVNDFLSKAGMPFRIKLLVEDTASKPDVALEKLKTLAAKGVKIVVGSASSGEARNIMGYAEANKILILSGMSTAPELAIPRDNLFRLCPDDNKQGKAISRVIYDSGVRYIIPVWRGDAWGDGLVKAARERFEELGGKFLEGIRYAPEAKEFSAEVSVLSSKVTDAIGKYGRDKVGIYYAAFEEAITFFTQAAGYPVLSEVKWFGTDGTVLGDKFITETIVAEFCVKTGGFVNPVFAPTRSSITVKVENTVKEKLGRTPDAYTYSVYDTLWLAVKCILAAGKYDADAIKNILPTVAKTTFGASGWLELNEAGDRETADYELWYIVKENGEYAWKLAGIYTAASDSVTWL
ncbi:MAG: ABC transporter substrate-binding protein [Candidatus Methanomethylicia archaeon]